MYQSQNMGTTECKLRGSGVSIRGNLTTPTLKKSGLNNIFKY